MKRNRISLGLALGFIVFSLNFTTHCWAETTQQKLEYLWKYHICEANRASQWVRYHASRSAQSERPQDSYMLAQQWRTYEMNQNGWAAFYYQKLVQEAAQNHESSQKPSRLIYETNYSGGANFSSHLSGTDATVALPHITMRSGIAFGLRSLPMTLHRLIGAANWLQDKPYILGGGHHSLEAKGYDCSGATSFVLFKAGLINSSLNSSSFANYGEPGPGHFVTIWVKPGHHVFMTICGLRLDTSGGSIAQGPRWRTDSRSYSGFIPRHPRHL